MVDRASERPDWDTLFLGLAFLVAMRSPDADTKHGAVVVDARRRVLGTGFNGFPRGCRDDQLPRHRPGKYPFVVHAEINALVNSREIPDPEQCTIYVTGEPCNECFKTIIQFGIGRIVHGGVGSNCIDTDSEHRLVRSAIHEGLAIQVEQYPGPIQRIAALLDSASRYAAQRGMPME
jgi:dCMP deaminase